MDHTSIISDIKAKKYAPIYFLEGKEPYFIDLITQYIHDNVLDESEREFNLTVMYGKDCDVSMVINNAKRFPMMAPYQVVIVKEAQNLAKIEDLIYYAENPQPQTILVLNYKYKNLDKRKALTKRLKDKHVFFESKPLYDNQIPDWIQSYVKFQGLSISNKSSVMLSEFLGSDLSKLVGEIDKLKVLLEGKGSEITPQLIETNIGLSKDFNVFELQKALIDRDVFKANLILNHFSKNPKNNAIQPILSNLFLFFSNLMVAHYQSDRSKFALAKVLKVNPYFANDYIKALQSYSAGKVFRILTLIRNADAKSKGVNSATTTSTDLLKELVFQILH